MQLDQDANAIVGPGGHLPVAPSDELTCRLAMLIEGECEGLTRSQVARKYGLSKQRYYQLRNLYLAHGASALQPGKRGPKSNHRRTDEVVRQVIRHRFLDPKASPDVIAQKLRQSGVPISTRSVERTIAQYGLQKKTLSPADR